MSKAPLWFPSPSLTGKGLAVILFAFFAIQSLPAEAARTLRVAAAADLEPVLPALIAEFHRLAGVDTQVSYASSATLAAEILNGAPFDLFLAADLSFPEKVIAAGLGDSARPVTYARGTLVLWARNDSGIRNLNLDAFRDPALRTVAVANAAHAPYGRAAMAALQNLGLADALKGKLVVAENIAQAAQYVDSGNAELGLISLTSALAPRLSSAGRYFEMPADSYPPILQGAVVLKDAPAHEDAHRFLDFLLSSPVKKELEERGLRAP